VNTSSNSSASDRGSERTPNRPSSALRRLWPRLIELWLLAVLDVFFLIRVLGSGSAQRILQSLRHHRP
jgi:hypothetical protein